MRISNRQLQSVARETADDGVTHTLEIQVRPSRTVTVHPFRKVPAGVPDRRNFALPSWYVDREGTATKWDPDDPGEIIEDEGPTQPFSDYSS